MSATVMTEQPSWAAGTSPSESAPAVSGDERIVFRGVDWHTYNQLSESLGEHQRVHLVYDGKDLEIMVIGDSHEILKNLISKIVTAVAMGLDVDCLGSGQATWKTEIRGLEADLSYYFNAEKIRTATAAWARRSRHPADYPRPDLAIEIDLSPSQVDRPAVYKEIAVTEVWSFVSGETFIFEQLQPDGSYAAVEESQFLRIRPDDVMRWVNEAATERPAVWIRRLNQWAMGLSRPAQETEHA